MSREVWVRYNDRDSIVEIFKENGDEMVRELWPCREPREHATKFSDSGLQIIDREVHWCADAEDDLSME